MHLLHIATYLLGLLAISVSADLSCLKWDLLGNPLGLLCHFKPELYTQVTDSVEAAVKAVETAGHDLLHFDWTHMPATVTYNYVQNAVTGGLSLANNGLANATHDYVEVGIGFGKDVTNQAVQIYNLLDWSDVSICMINGTGNYLDAVMPFTSEAARHRFSECTTKKFSKSLSYNITEPNQKVGATISEIAALLAPVSGPESAGKDAVRLAIPGSDEFIYKAVKAGSKASNTGGEIEMTAFSKTGDYFKSPEEAQMVADAAADPEYVKKKCFLGSPPSNAISAKRSLREHPRTRHRRGELVILVCDLPSFKSGVPPVVKDAELRDPSQQQKYAAKLTDEEAKEARAARLKKADQKVYYDGPTDDQLVTAPSFAQRDLRSEVDLHNFAIDLTEYGTGLIKSSDQVIAASDRFFEKLDVALADRELMKLLKLRIRYPEFRFFFVTEDAWMTLRDPRILFIQEFAEAIVRDTIQNTARLRGLNPDDLTAVVEFYASVPNTVSESEATLSVLPYHRDGSIMTYGGADRSGLVIWPTDYGTNTRKAFRVPVVKDAYYGWPGRQFNPGDKWSGTFHAVFGQDMQDNGRFSWVVIVKRKETQPGVAVGGKATP